MNKLSKFVNYYLVQVRYQVIVVCNFILLLVIVVILLLSVYYFIYTRINASTDNRVIFVPPKKPPTLPFGLGPAPEPAKPSDFTKTTYKIHETALVKEAVQQLLMSAGISFFIGYQWKIYLSLLVQALTMPFNLWDAVIFRKYVLGHTKNDDGSNLYDEQFTQPTKESIAIAEKLAAARAAGVGKEGETTATPSVAKSAIAADEPRVVEITEEKPSEKTEKENKEKASAAHDID